MQVIFNAAVAQSCYFQLCNLPKLQSSKQRQRIQKVQTCEDVGQKLAVVCTRTAWIKKKKKKIIILLNRRPQQQPQCSISSLRRSHLTNDANSHSQILVFSISFSTQLEGGSCSLLPLCPSLPPPSPLNYSSTHYFCRIDVFVFKSTKLILHGFRMNKI